MTKRPRVLIEEWLPVTELGIESRRESAPIPGQFPKLKTLHVWWARRPLAAAAGAILASIMPAWSEDLPDRFSEAPELRTEKDYHEWFLRLCGILGDPVAAKRAQVAAIEAGVRIPNPYTYKPAFKNSPFTRDLRLLHSVLEGTWGTLPNVLDPTAGGGSIPYEAIRYGLPTHANDLNSVAAGILTAGVAVPARWGKALLPELRHWGNRLVSRVSESLASYFPSGPGEEVATYLFARTVACPRTGKPVPLSPNWWLSKGKDKDAAVQLITERDGDQLGEIEFAMVTGEAARDANPDRGTVAGGDAVSPWDDLPIKSEYIKAEAQAGRMGSQLFAVAVRINGKRTFRSPTHVDLDALAAAEGELERRMPAWEKANVLPTEEFPAPIPKHDIRPYGFRTWRDFFSPRQLLVHGVLIESYRELLEEIRDEIGDADRADAVAGVLGMLIGKAVNYNGITSSWSVTRSQIRSVFDRHDFSLKWSFAEFEGAREFYPWCLDQVVEAYGSIASLLAPSDADSLQTETLQHQVPGPAEVTCQNGGDLQSIPDGSQTLVCIDPPYGDNVMYAELADYFYVWEKRALGQVWPEFFSEELTDKKSEAVVNIARFLDTGRRRNELAVADYEAKMQAIFAECHRVLAEHGVMTVMFTHKSSGTWDALAASLMEAGFTMEASWPVNTESEQSLHQVKKNAAASTVMLVCRKREAQDTGAFFEDLEPEVRSAARDALVEFGAKGITGVDLLLSTYGPALSVISSRWPVFSSIADPVTGRSQLLRPEEALNSARAEVTRLQRQRLVGRDQTLDPLTDFSLVAWDTFKAVSFPFDEARRLALAIGGLDVEELRHARILEKKSGTVTLLPPSKRMRREADHEAGLPGVYPEATSFAIAIDAVHTLMHIADVDGLAAAKAFLDRTGLASDGRFLAALQGLVNAVPMTRLKGDWVLPEAATLDRLCTAYFPDIDVPQEPETEVFTQESLLGAPEDRG
jgi:putative DNA methylase